MNDQRSTERPLTIVISGPGGVGKGTIADALVRRDPRLWLSRSWTTRPRRPSERTDAYVFTTRDEFERRIAQDGFLEWTDFLGHLYGTPLPDPAAGSDIVLEIELDGAQQVLARQPDAIVIFVLPPSRDEQERRLRGRGDPPARVAARLGKAESEEPIGKVIADHVVVNDDLETTIVEMLELIEAARARQVDAEPA